MVCRDLVQGMPQHIPFYQIACHDLLGYMSRHVLCFLSFLILHFTSRFHLITCPNLPLKLNMNTRSVELSLSSILWWILQINGDFRIQHTTINVQFQPFPIHLECPFIQISNFNCSKGKNTLVILYGLIRLDLSLPRNNFNLVLNNSTLSPTIKSHLIKCLSCHLLVRSLQSLAFS